MEDALLFETSCINHHWSSFLNLFKKERIETARRAIILRPKNLTWQWQDQATILINFWLPAGCFGTSIIRELIV